VPQRSNEHEFLTEVLQGHPEAVSFVEQVSRISQVWDDLVDGDSEVPGDAINAAFWESITLPDNTFYASHYGQLQPLLKAAMADWMAANDLELAGDHQRNLAFVLRDNLAAVVIEVARLVGGYSWMRSKAAAIREHVHAESLETYKESCR
jgi:hypothetical protein